jgi:uncharacterized protein YndB with AHSA1/START domain
MTIEVLDDAKDDLIDGFHFYAEQSPGLGSYFLDSLFADIDSLLLYAGIHRLAVKDWIERRGFKTLYVEPGSPWQNAYSESFNSRFRDEFLNRESFASLLEAKVLGKEHRHRHNRERPHSSLDYQTPVEFAQRSLAAASATLRQPQGCALSPANTKPTTQDPKTTKHSHSEWIKNRGQARRTSVYCERSEHLLHPNRPRLLMIFSPRLTNETTEPCRAANPTRVTPECLLASLVGRSRATGERGWPCTFGNPKLAPIVTMNNYQSELSLSASMSAVYEALTTPNGIRNWWTTSCEVGTSVGEMITIRFGQTYKVMRIEDLIPETEVCWRVIDAHLSVPGLARTSEWIGTTIIFHLSSTTTSTTLLHMKHLGLTPQVECYDICSQGWTQFLGSLKSYLETGSGTPYAQ